MDIYNVLTYFSIIIPKLIIVCFMSMQLCNSYKYFKKEKIKSYIAAPSLLVGLIELYLILYIVDYMEFLFLDLTIIPSYVVVINVLLKKKILRPIVSTYLSFFIFFIFEILIIIGIKLLNLTYSEIEDSVCLFVVIKWMCEFVPAIILTYIFKKKKIYLHIANGD